jgi:pimeloyl-ACP methyl ester carboxylesterase
MNKNVRIAIAAVLAIGAIAYSKWSSKADADSTAKSPSTGQFRIAANDTEFRFGQFTFKSCELAQKYAGTTTAAFCAPFEVPENRADPQSRKISLNLALVPSHESADDDFIVFLAGGPGQAAIETWPQIAGALDSARKRRHVLLLDQRGTGGSNALTCEAFSSNEELQGFDMARVTESTAKCLAEVSDRADPRFYTTSDAVQDLEDLRQALGAPQFNLVGVSYGTRVAQQYLKRHADGVRSIVLDSPVPNELILGSEFGRNLDEALHAQFAQCAANEECKKSFPDPYADLLSLRDQLNAEPQQVSYPDPVSFAARTTRLDGYGLTGLIRMFAYTPETAALIPHIVSEAKSGNYAPLLGQLAIINRSVGELAGSGMQLSVICAEDADLIPETTDSSNTFFGTLMLDVIKSQCSIWPRGARPDDFHVAASGDKPILVLTGEFDPVTPPRYGEQIVKQLDNAKLINTKGQGHNVIGRGCLPKLVSQFMEKRAPDELDASCADTLGPLPHFVNFNGATP